MLGLWPNGSAFGDVNAENSVGRFVAGATPVGVAAEEE